MDTYWQIVADGEALEKHKKLECCSYVVDPDSFRIYIGFLHAKICRAHGLRPGSVCGGWIYPQDLDKVMFKSGYLDEVPRNLQSEVRSVLLDWIQQS